MILLLYHIRVFEMSFQLLGALNSGIAHFANLFRVEQFPFLIVKLVIELNNELGMYEI